MQTGKGVEEQSRAAKTPYARPLPIDQAVGVASLLVPSMAKVTATWA